jgi:hypothetical protein
MQNLNLPKGDLITHKMQINLYVLGPLMLDWIGSQILGTDIITEYQSSLF